MKLIHTENNKLTSTMRASVSSVENSMYKRGPPPRRSFSFSKKNQKENNSPASSTSLRDLDDEMFYSHMNNSYLDSDNDIQSSDSKTNAAEKKVKKTVTIKLPPTGRAEKLEKLRELFIKAKNRRKNKNVKEKPSALRQNKIEHSKDSMDDIAHPRILKQNDNIVLGETNVSDGDSNSYNSDSGVSMQTDGKYKRERNRRIFKNHHLKTEILKKEETSKKDGKVHYIEVEIHQQNDPKREQPPKFNIAKNGESVQYSKILLKKDKAVQCEQEEDDDDDESDEEEEEKLVYPKSPHVLKFSNLKPNLTSRIFNARYENVNPSPSPPVQIKSIKEHDKDDVRVSVRAVYSLKSTSPQTLSFTAGDIGQLVERDSNGWWLIRVCDQEGWSPANHWEILDKPVPIPRKKEVRFPDTATCDWFIGKIGRRDSESRLLRNGQDRDFMIRESTTRVG